MLGYIYKSNTYCYGNYIEDLISYLDYAINKCNALDNCHCIQYHKGDVYVIKESTDWRSDSSSWDSWVNKF